MNYIRVHKGKGKCRNQKINFVLSISDHCIAEAAQVPCEKIANLYKEILKGDKALLKRIFVVLFNFV